ncbi:MAG: B12-binding domain-containing radical SAM protein [Candidatus Odinarchaeia archaeon]
MKILLINPMAMDIKEAFDSRSAAPPIGILYVASMLESNGYEVKVIDQPGEKITDKKLMDKVKKIDPDLVGFSTLTATGKRAAIQARKIKEWNPNLTIVFGGYHATINGEKLLKNYPFIDYALKGEGEYTSVQLVRLLEKNKLDEIKKIPGIVYRENGLIKNGPPHRRIEDLDALPFPDRSHIKHNEYGYISNANIPKFTSILTSRGCPYRCTYCACAAFHNRTWRTRSPENIADEFEEIVSEGYENLLVIDDNFTLNPKHVIKVTKLLRKRRIEINWIAEGRVDRAQLPMLKSMVKAGCKIIYYGVESANQRILDYYKKGTTPEQAVKAVENARKARIDIITATFIVGAPTESVSEIQNTLNFASKLDIDFPQFNILAAVPGSTLYEQLASEGVLDPEVVWEDAPNVPQLHPECVPEEKINQMIIEAYKKFTSRKHWIIKEVVRTFKSRYRLYLVTKNIPNAKQFYNQLMSTFHVK